MNNNNEPYLMLPRMELQRLLNILLRFNKCMLNCDYLYFRHPLKSLEVG
jgi:hypothetical protein